MAISYSCDCKTVDTYPSQSSKLDVIYNVHWRLTATSGSNAEYTATSIGTQVIQTADLSSFTSFDSLTNSTVTDWVTGSMGDTRVASLKSSLDATIDEKITPTSVTKIISDE